MKGLRPGQPVLTVTDLKRKFGDRRVLDGVSFSLQPGDRVGVLGVNGAGKSSLMKILAGHDKEFEGVCALARGATVGYVAQEPRLDLEVSVRENVVYGLRREPAAARDAAATRLLALMRLSDLADRQLNFREHRGRLELR